VPFNFLESTHQRGLTTLVQVCTMVSLIVTVVVYALTNRAIGTFVYKIEYDAVTNQFVVTQPSTSLLQFGKPVETVLEFNELKMLNKAQIEANSS
jgi:hypothetical protein